jgi:hypothetical protein
MKKFVIIDSSYPIEKLLPFCDHAITDPRPGAENMSPVDWEENKASFLYLLYCEKRYNGLGNGYIIYIENDNILCGSGFHESSIDSNMTHLSSRSYTIPGIQRPRAHGDIHTMAIDRSIEIGRHGAINTVNEYNRRFLNYIAINDPANYPKYYYKDGKHFGKPNFRIHPYKLPDNGPFKINYTKQWMLYMMWNEHYEETFKKILENVRWIDV